jgi:hypothetical protein
MSEVGAFKSGKDLGEETQVEDDERVTCISCGAEESDEAAFQAGWQLVPPVCPDCQRWTIVDQTCCFRGPS